MSRLNVESVRHPDATADGLQFNSDGTVIMPSVADSNLAADSQRYVVFDKTGKMAVYTPPRVDPGSQGLITKVGSETFVAVINPGETTLTLSEATTFSKILVVGGGGGGSNGGGGGGLVALCENFTIPAGTYTMEIGAGGGGNQATGGAGVKGSDTVMFKGSSYAVTATGGGAGALQDQYGSASYNGANGGGAYGWNGGSSTVSGGTGTKPSNVSASASNVWGSTSTITYYGGNAGGGGRSLDIGGPDGGSGGGAGAAGVSNATQSPPNGGAGVQITGMGPDGNTYYWAAGGGGRTKTGTKGLGANGSSGPYANAPNGGYNNVTSTAAGANTGSGGGADGTAGAAGIIVLKYTH